MPRLVQRPQGAAGQSPGQQERSALRRERILDAALQVFTRTGYRDAAMDEIAVAAETSKGGLYFHFPGKQTIFLALLDSMADLLLSRARKAMADEADPLARGDAALRTVLHTFASHKRLTHLFLIEAMGAGREFNDKMLQIHQGFATLIQSYLDDLVASGLIAPIETRIASLMWFGALNEVVTHWVLTNQPADLEDVYPSLRALLLYGIASPSAMSTQSSPALSSLPHVATAAEGKYIL